MRDRRLELVSSEAKLRELSDVLARPRIARCIPPEAAERALWLYLHAAIHFDPAQVPRVCRDQSDDFLLAPAVASKADLLVTRDEDLLMLGRHGTTRIVYPTQLLQLLGTGAST